jgi:hypothetical protein
MRLRLQKCRFFASARSLGVLGVDLAAMRSRCVRDIPFRGEEHPL